MARQDFYNDCKRLHLCTECMKQDARTLAGRTRCYECAEKARERAKKPEYQKADLERQKRRYHERKARGLCPQCGKRKPAPGFASCEICMAKDRRSSEKCRRKRGQRDVRLEMSLGNCYICFKPAAPGKKLCPDCIERVKKNLKHQQKEE